MTIRSKLKLMILLVCAAAVLIAEMSSMALSFFSYQKNLSDDLEGLASVIGQNASVALMFDIPRDAEQVLSSLKLRTSIQTACMYDDTGALFAVYRKPGTTGAVHETLALPEAAVSEKQGGMYSVSVPVVVGGRRVGAIRLTDDMSSIRASLMRDAVIYGIIILATLVLAYLLSLPLQKRLIEPILHLAATARTVSIDRDFSVRAQKKDDDEIGMLTDSFNGMLAQIQQRETDLRKSEDRFRAIAEHSPDAIITSDRAAMILYCNSAAEKMFGYSQQEMVGQKTTLLLPQRMHESEKGHRALLAQTPAAVMKGATMESRALRKDGTEFPIEISLFGWEIDDEACFAAMIRDISQRKQAEEQLRDREERLRSVVETAVDAIITTDSRGKIISWNKAAEAIYGYRAEEALGRDVSMLVPENSRQKNSAGMKEFFDKQQPDLTTRSFESVSLRKDGTEFPAEISQSVWLSGGQYYATGIVRDITDRKRADEEIRQARNYLEKIFRASPDAIFVADEAGSIVMANESFFDVYGYRPEEIIGQHVSVLATDNEAEVQKSLAMIEELYGKGIIRDFQGERKRKDGSIVQVEASHVLLKNTDGSIAGSVASTRDITDRKRLEAQLWQAQKMEAVGTLAGGIAHDFNNILTAIIGFTELSQGLAAGNSLLDQNLAQVLRAGNRAKSLVQQILAFSRKTESELKPLQTHLIIKEVLKLLRASIPTTIDLRFSIDDKDDIVIADATQIHQIVMNLCTNAAHAMQQAGGSLEILSRPVELEEQDISEYAGIEPGPYLHLSVKDSGAGISQDIIGRIFEPFFTTKEAGTGTGMGLSVVHGIVKSLKGDIKVYSEEGRGTVFHVLLPRVEEAELEAQAVAPELRRGRESVLLVDDEELLLDVGGQILASLGYRVTALQSPVEALELFKTNADAFDIVITDQTMPRLTGYELARELLQARPDIPIVLCTGYSDQVTEESALSLGIRAFVIKPLNRQVLSETVRAVLDKKRAV